MEGVRDPKNDAVRYLAVGLFCSFVCSVVIPLSNELFPLMLANLARLQVWTLITAGLFESSLIMMIVNVACVVVIGPSLVQRWGTNGFLKFVLLVDISVNILTFATLMIEYAVLQSNSILRVHYCGFVGISVGLCVAFKQANSDRVFFSVSSYEILKGKYLPILLILFCLVLVFITGCNQFAFAVFGFFVSWIYLRFYKVETLGSITSIGDRREEFSFASFFPAAFSPIFVKIVAFFKKEPAINSHIHAVSEMIPDYDNKIDPAVDKRRALAIKAIDEKLAALSSVPSHSNV